MINLKEYRQEHFIQEKSVLSQKYGMNKKIPEFFELQALLALSHFPELKDVKINFLLEKADFAFAARPDYKTIFRKKMIGHILL